MSELPNQDDIRRGQAIYTKQSLPLYDLLITKFSNRFAWRCPQAILLHLFKVNTSKNHLDIGVGTGSYLQNLHLNPASQRIGLMDMNKDCLDYAATVLSRFHPEIYQQNIFEPFVGISKNFDSVSLNYVLHCLPGTLQQKAVVFDHIKTVLNPGGKCFGSTILGKGVDRNWLAEKLTMFYNEKKVFGNLNDDLETLQAECGKRFEQVSIKTQGCVALFVVS